MAYRTLTNYRRPMMRGGFSPSTGWSGSTMLTDLNRQINSLFDDLFDFDSDDENDGRNRGFFNRSRFAAPAMDVASNDKRYEITAELPGVKEDDIELTVQDNVLILKGEKRQTRTTDSDEGWSERSYGTFERRIQLPQDVNDDAVEADFENGVLTIMLPRVEEKERGRKIELKGSRNSKSQFIDSDSKKVEENA